MTLRRTPLKRKTPLKAHKGLNQVSPKRLEELRAELPVRLTLIKRCGGRPIIRDYPITVNGVRVTVTTALCYGGICKICGKPAQQGEILEPHENLFRSRGGKMSLENTVMCHRQCHNKEHRIERGLIRATSVT